MNKYRKLLVLQYLEEKMNDYSIEEIFARLGFEAKQGNELLEEMFKEGLIAYENYLIMITSKGKRILEKVPNNYLKIYEDNVFMNIDILPKLKIGDIFIPSKF